MATRINLLSTEIKEMKRTVAHVNDDLELKMQEIDIVLDKKVKLILKEFDTALEQVGVFKGKDSLQDGRISLIETKFDVIKE